MLTKNDLQKIRQAISDIAVTKEEAKLFTTKDDLKPIKKDLKKIRKDLEMVTGSFDEELLGHEKRLKALESPLLTSTN